MSALVDELGRRSEIELAVATSVRGQEALERYAEGGVTYFCLPSTKTQGGRISPEFATACETVLSDFGPDLIHVHGTEEIYGLFTAQRTSSPPAVISIQGLVSACSRHVMGGISLGEASEAGLHGVLSWLRFMLQRRSWNGRGLSERRILRGNRYFIGRTAWDEAHLLASNPTARYFHCGELLRPPFHDRRWDVHTAARRTVFCTAAYSPLKGFHVLLGAVATLRKEFPDIKVRVAGAPWDDARGHGYYGRYIRALIDKLDLSNNILPLPALSAEQVADEMASASVFAVPSLIENSSNSLAEAMLVGTPCVAALVGGIPSMIEDGRTALGFHSGDAAHLAHCLRRIFVNDSLAVSLSSAARSTARARHEPGALVTTQLRIYQQVISEHQEPAI